MITRHLLVAVIVAVCGLGLVSEAKDDGPLFLSPYIFSHQIEKAKQLAEVPPLAGDIKSYAGFFTVNATTNSSLYLWYFPAENPTPDTPVMLWLDGWSTSMLYGVFMDHGPFQIDLDLNVSLREHTWQKLFHMVYIDSLVGTGFSFTQSPYGYNIDQFGIRHDLYATLNQFFMMFSELKSNPFILAGESYGGHYVPALGDLISQDPSFNLTAIILGNPWVDPLTQLGYGAHLHDVGLIDSQTLVLFEQTQDLIATFLGMGYEFQAALALGNLIFTQGVTTYTEATGNTYYYNYVNDTLPPEPWREYVQTPSARQKMHTGNIPLQAGVLSSAYLSRDVIRSTKPYLEKLIEKYNVLLYNGQLDIICAYPMMSNMIKSMNCTDCSGIFSAPRSIWRSETGLVAGYIKSHGHLTEVLVKEAGHMAIVDQPAKMFELIQNYVSQIL